MPTKPKPIWERWIETPKGREQLYKIYFIGMIVLNLFIVVGLILFMVFYLMRK